MDYSNEKNGSIDDSIINGINNKDSRSSEKNTLNQNKQRQNLLKELFF